ILNPKEEPRNNIPDKGEFLGWQDTEWLYLIPEAAFKAINQFCREAGEPFTINEDRLRRDLIDEGISKINPGRKTGTARIGSNTRRVLQLNIAKLAELAGEELVTAVTDITGFKSRGGYTSEDEKWHTR